jgi:hypothetical protein
MLARQTEAQNTHGRPNGQSGALPASAPERQRQAQAQAQSVRQETGHERLDRQNRPEPSARAEQAARGEANRRAIEAHGRSETLAREQAANGSPAQAYSRREATTAYRFERNTAQPPEPRGGPERPQVEHRGPPADRGGGREGGGEHRHGEHPG